MNNDHPKWNFKEFSAFLLLHAASADLKITTEEKELILQKVNQATFDQISKEYNSFEDQEILDTILIYKGLYYPTAERTNELLDMVKKEFLADGDYSLIEKNLMRILKKLM